MMAAGIDHELVGQVLSVGDVTTYLKALLGSDDLLGDLWVRGEVSNLSRSAAGHTYFTLKDAEGQLRCVMFRGHGGYSSGARDLRQGSSALAHGHVSLYETQGSVQLYADYVQGEGVGSLHQRFEDLKARLKDEGLFDEERKRPIPPFPRRIGVVTSPGAAALQDVLRVLTTRFPAAEVVLSPCLVQGDVAPPQIAAALRRVDGYDGVEVVLVVRGGGSLEDLWAYNTETVARAIAACATPVVTGVGHEPDVTIADYVADLRMPTPSTAAAAVVPDWQECAAAVSALRDDLRECMAGAVADARRDLREATRTLALLNPLVTVRTRRQQTDDLQTALRERMARLLQRRREALRGADARLALLDPLATLERGYAIVTNPWGEVVSDAGHVTPGETLRVRVRGGSFDVAVLDSTRKQPSPPDPLPVRGTATLTPNPSPDRGRGE